MPPFLSASTFSASLHIPRSGGPECELQIKHYTDLNKKNEKKKKKKKKKKKIKKKKKKKKKLHYSQSVVYRFTLVSRKLLARAARAVHHLFDDLSTNSGLVSTKTKRFGYFVACVTSVSVRLSFHFLPASRTLYRASATFLARPKLAFLYSETKWKRLLRRLGILHSFCPKNAYSFSVHKEM